MNIWMKLNRFNWRSLKYSHKISLQKKFGWPWAPSQHNGAPGLPRGKAFEHNLYIVKLPRKEAEKTVRWSDGQVVLVADS
jgi:hypothetical protein